LKEKGIKSVIPFKANEKANRDNCRKPDGQPYKKRNVVERCFAILKENRRIATRSEKNGKKLPEHVKTGCNQVISQATVRLRDTAQD